MNTLFWLCLEFFKTGLFSIGGGLATLPFLSQMSINHPEWFTQEMLADMIAVSESTPGPIGVNMATYAGFTVAGILGSVLATFSLVLPSVITILIVAKFLSKYMDSKGIRWAFSGLRPAVTGLIAAAGYSVIKTGVLTGNSFSGFSNLLSFFDWRCAVLFVVILAASQLPKLKKIHPIFYIMTGAVVGIVFSF